MVFSDNTIIHGGICVDNKSKNSKEFITIYNELDDYMRRELNQDHWVSHSELIRKYV